MHFLTCKPCFLNLEWLQIWGEKVTDVMWIHFNELHYLLSNKIFPGSKYSGINTFCSPCSATVKYAFAFFWLSTCMFDFHQRDLRYADHAYRICSTGYAFQQSYYSISPEATSLIPNLKLSWLSTGYIC